jgi:hypothetical protein
MIFAVVEMGPILHTCAGILEQFMWAWNPVGTVVVTSRQPI